jgi:hypothetical protein
MGELIQTGSVERRIFFIRGLRVMIDRDLAELYGVPTFVLNQAVGRNRMRFPEGFMFRLSRVEARQLITDCDRFVTLKHSSVPPLAFTEYGVAMLSSVLHSARAIRINIRIIQAFIHLRRWALTGKEVALRLDELERLVGTQDREIGAILDALRQRLKRAPKAKPVIGFQT